MFRHQLSTLAILLDYKIVDPVLLKAAVIHDLFEDAPAMPGVIRRRDHAHRLGWSRGLRLVMEVTIRGRAESGSRSPSTCCASCGRQPRARVLKLADRISNLTALGFVTTSPS